MKPGIERRSPLQSSSLRRRWRERASALMMRISNAGTGRQGAVKVNGAGNTYRVTPGTAVAMLRWRGGRRGGERRRMPSMDGNRLRVVMRVMVGWRMNELPLMRGISRREIRRSMRPRWGG
jgi:hypothetical protein